jgi:hypothetical protein
MSFTRPNLAFAVHKVGEYMHHPMEENWEAVKRILRYLKHIIHHALFILATDTFQLHTFNDSDDYASDRDNRRSIDAYCAYLGANLISWSCKQQQTIAGSNTKA